MAVGVDVGAFDLHHGAVPHRPFDHGSDLGRRAVDQLGVDRHALALDVPVDEHAAAGKAREFADS